MDAFEVVRRLRARQAEILEALPADLHAMYQEAESMVRHLDHRIIHEGAYAQVEETPALQRLMSEAEGSRRQGRISLVERREALRDFLRDHGPARRGQILVRTRIPAGSLSLLLTEPEFERREGGIWRLRKGTH